MPRGSKYPGPPEALEQYLAVVELCGADVAVKGAKNPYTSRNGHMFSFLDAEGAMALRLSPELTEAFRSAYDSGDVTSHGATMRGYSSVPAALFADAEALAEWVGRSWEWIGTLPAKPTKKAARKTSS